MRWSLSLFCYVGTTSLCLLAASAGHADEAADRAALGKIRTLYEEVVKSDDLTRLMPYLSQNATAVTPTGEEVKNPQELQAYFKKIWELIGKGGAYEVKVKLSRTDLYGDTAVSHGTTDESIRTGAGKVYQFPMLWTAVSRRENDGWKVIRMHGSIDPLTNVFVTTQLNATKWIYGLGGLLLGLVVGILTRFVLPKHR